MLADAQANHPCFFISSRLVLLSSSGDNDPPVRGQRGHIRPSVREERETMVETRGGITAVGNNGLVNASLCVSVSKEAFMGGWAPRLQQVISRTRSGEKGQLLVPVLSSRGREAGLDPLCAESTDTPP